MNAHRSAAPEAPTEQNTGAGWWVQSVLSWLLLFALAGLLVVTIVLPLVVGGHRFTILTGSMKPAYPPGTLVVVRPEEPVDLAVGTPITYQIRSGAPEVVTHRIVQLRRTADGEIGFVTRGDANRADDEQIVRPEQIRGAVWYSIPYLGYVNNWFSGPKRTYTIAVLVVLLGGYALFALATDTRDRMRARRERR
ncbi:signal peptidase I [Nocardia harenae]|uniref:signal peptidase I n=1 Tax=Nocardia harenae TaxID=358707 RepID=UPI000AF767BE|nr:signal peptidase I [Nocardia harenae]